MSTPNDSCCDLLLKLDGFRTSNSLYNYYLQFPPLGEPNRLDRVSKAQILKWPGGLAS
jgi:hypothetical protein